jgi:hypothetical protein
VTSPAAMLELSTVVSVANADEVELLEADPVVESNVKNIERLELNNEEVKMVESVGVGVFD